MTDAYIRDTRHGQLVPTGANLEHVVANVFQRAALDFRRGQSLHRWIPVFSEAVRPILGRYVHDGRRVQARHILEQFGNPPRYKSLSSYNGSEHVDEFIRNWSYTFARSTLDTAAGDALKAGGKVRVELLRGIDNSLVDRINAIFLDRHRARRIARTEAHRAFMAGQVALARESTLITWLQWRANATACDICLALDGKIVTIGEAFDVDMSQHPTYAVTYHPPRHPWCACGIRSLPDPVAVEIVRRHRPAPKSLASRIWDAIATVQRIAMGILYAEKSLA